MTNDHHLVNLLDLLEEEGSALQVHLLTVVYHVLVEDFVVGRRKRHAREQITRDAYQQKPSLSMLYSTKEYCKKVRNVELTTEEGQIVVQELGQVDIDDGAKEQDVFVFFRVFQLQVSGRSEDGLDGAHAVIVVML